LDDRQVAAKYFKKVDELLARALKNEPVTEDESTVSTKEPVARARAQSPLETKDEIKPPAPRIKKSKSAPPKLDIIQKMELGFPETTAAGKIKNTCENARHAIKLLGITCEYDEFHDKLIIGGQPIGQYAGELTDHACLYLRKMIEEQYDFDPLREKMFDACVQLALENRFDPIVDYLNAPTWDGVCRVGNWLSVYFGAEDTPLNRAIGRIALVAQVRRARQPGCKFDQIIVLESPEGWQKSTALRAGAERQFHVEKR
jgi:hypothetical protein